MQYTSELKRLVLPEYGRNVQQMVDHCMTIEDKAERTRCANTIINIMGNLFPHLRDIEDFKHKLWDHLAIMSDFKLDIDYPYEIIKKENLHTVPESVPYQASPIKYRHYGKIMEEMLKKAESMPDGPERSALVSMLANHMKKLYQIIYIEYIGNIVYLHFFRGQQCSTQNLQRLIFSSLRYQITI